MPEVLVRPPAEDDEDYRADTADTATRTETPLRDIPQAGNVVPDSLIESQRAFTLRDALRNVPGLTLAAGEGGRTGDSITLRGFAANSDTYIDGVKDNGQYFRDTFFIKRIEVLKGPSSVLFGRGATGGVVNLISKKPQREPLVEADLTLGSFDLKRLSVDGNAAGVPTPWSTQGTLAVRLRLGQNLVGPAAMQAKRGRHFGGRLAFTHALKRHHTQFFQRRSGYSSSVSLHERVGNDRGHLFPYLLIYE